VRDTGCFGTPGGEGDGAYFGLVFGCRGCVTEGIICLSRFGHKGVGLVGGWGGAGVFGWGGGGG